MYKTSGRKEQAQKVTVVGMIVNIFLALFKLCAGIFGKSSAMIADATHSFSDFATDIIALLSFHVSHKPQDKNHHYGHGKFETLAALSISVVLVVVGVGIFYSSALRVISFFRGELLIEPHVIAFVAASVSIISKELLYRYTIKIGRQINSQAVIANAWEHRSDALSSIGAAIGVGGAIVLGPHWSVLDPIAGIVVSIFVIRAGIMLSYENIQELTEGAMSEEDQQKIIDLTAEVDGVYNPHNIRTRKIGHYYAIDMHMEVDKDLTVEQAHELEHVYKKKLRELFGQDTIITIHVDPLREHRL